MAVSAYTTLAPVKMRRSDRSSLVRGGVCAPARSLTMRRRSLPGVVPRDALCGAFSFVKNVSLGMNPLSSAEVCARCASALRPPVTPSFVSAWNVSAVSAEARITVGARARAAVVRETPGPATEFSASVVCEKRAAAG